MDTQKFARSMVASCLVTIVALTFMGSEPSHASSPGFGWSTPTTLPAPRAGAAVAVGHDGNIYVFGGTNGVTEDYNSVFVYHPRGNSWSMGATMPFAVEGNAAVTLPDGRIMVMGGGTGCHVTQQCTTYKTVEVYDPKLHSWCLLAPMRTSHYRFPAVLGPDGRVYAIGGWDGREAVATVEAYNIRANTWTTVVSLPQAEESAAAVVIRHRIAVVGGFDGRSAASGAGTFYNNLFVYDGKKWESGSPMPTPRAQLAAAVGPQGLIFAIGGYTPRRYLSTVEAYNPQSDTWSNKSPLPKAVAIFSAATTADGHIYTLGGWDSTPSTQVAMYGTRATRHNPFTN